MAVSTWTNPPRTWSTSELVTAAIGNAHWRDQLMALKVASDTCSQGRLTLSTGTPVTTSDVTAATTIFYTPYGGNRISLFNTSGYWETGTFSERSLSLSGFAANTNFDIFIYDNAGTLTLENVAWASDTARATSLATQDGVLCKSGSLNKRYLGTFRTTGTVGQAEDSLTKRYVWNYYNRLRRPLRRQPGSTWTYTTATVRQANGSTANQVDVVVGVAEVTIDLSLAVYAANSSGGVAGVVGIGEDSTTAMSSEAVGQGYLNMTTAAVVYNLGPMRLVKMPAVGRHIYVQLEYSGVGGTTTWYSSDPQGVSASLGGLIGSIEG